jgi:hypothetical protein
MNAKGPRFMAQMGKEPRTCSPIWSGAWRLWLRGPWRQKIDTKTRTAELRFPLCHGFTAEPDVAAESVSPQLCNPSFGRAMETQRSCIHIDPKPNPPHISHGLVMAKNNQMTQRSSTDPERAAR